MKWSKFNWLLTFVLAALLFSSCKKGGEYVSASKDSPDGRFVVKMVELPKFDRNFVVRLVSKRTNSLEEIIFASPDEGRPVGTERFIWAKNSDAFMLVGNHFFTKTNLNIRTGENVYLLYHLQSKKLQCNAGQADLLPIDKADLMELQWDEDVF